MQRTPAGRQGIQAIYAQVRDEAQRTRVIEAVAQVLRDRHRIVAVDDFVIASQEDMLRTLQQVTGIFTIVLGCIAGSPC